MELLLIFKRTSLDEEKYGYDKLYVVQCFDGQH